MRKVEDGFQERVEPTRRPSLLRRVWLFLTTGWTVKKLFWWLLAIALARSIIIPLIHSLE